MGHEFGLAFADKHAAVRAVHKATSLTVVADANGSVRFDTARDVFVEGDNLEALRLLAGPYAGRVDAIYIDPPYNTGHDFVFRDDFGEGAREYLARTGQIDDRGSPLVSNPQTSGRYHSAWLGMMYPRLVLARRMLSDGGLLFCSIDDNEVHHLRALLDEVFGEDHFIAQVVVVSNRGGRDYLRIATGHEYVLVYGGSPDAPVREVPRAPAGPVRHDARGPFELRELRNRNPKFHPGNRPNLFFPIHTDPRRPDEDGCCPVSADEGPDFPLAIEPRNSAGEGSVWRWGLPRLRSAIASGEVVARQRRDGGFNVYEKHRKTTTKPRALWDDPAMRSEQGTIDLRAAMGAAVFDHPKPVALVRQCLALCDPNGLVLDFFAGSGTTGQAVVEQQSEQRMLLVQLPEETPAGSAAREAGYPTIADVARARLAAVLPADRGLRCFRLAEPGHPRWSNEAPTQLDALREHEAARADHCPGLWEVALAQGLRLDASVERLSDTVVRVRNPGDEGSAVVCLAARVEYADFATLALRRGTPVVCRESAVSDDTTLRRLVAEFDLRLW